MGRWSFVWVLAAASAVPAQTVCPTTPAYSPCEIVFDLNEQEAAAHPNPYLSVQLHAEFRSPRHHTYLVPAYWDGGKRLVIRFTPTDGGDWDYRLTSNLSRFDGKIGQVKATDSQDPGFIKPANVHHWMFTEGLKPHLWMGDTRLDLAILPASDVQRYIDARSQQKFTHVRVLVLNGDKSFPSPDTPNPEYFRTLDDRLRAVNQKGIFADLVIASGGTDFQSKFSAWQQRERLIRYIVARYQAFHVTWELMQEFEKTPHGRDVAKELGLLVKKFDAYGHPRSAHTIATSASLLADGWMTHVLYKTPDDALGAIEHQQYPVPFVNAEIGVEGTSSPEALRRGLWSATMNGQYPVLNAAAFNADTLDSAGAKMMSAWYEMFAATRHWELEPYFEVDGARAIALPGVEYIVYVEKPGPIEVLVEKHGYEVAWINPLNGERFKEKKDFKGDKFAAEPPDKQHEWVLHLSREGHKEGMLRSYKFESRPILLQEVEQNPARVPFEVFEPSADKISLGKAPRFQVKLKRETRATRTMLYLWTGEVPTEGQGYRILGTGAEGTVSFPPNLAESFPAVLNVRLLGLNANGKLYSLDKVYQLTQ